MQYLRELVGLNKNLIAELAKQNQIGAGTTLTGAIASPRMFEIFHIGDSEVWLLSEVNYQGNNNLIFQKITTDHQVENNKHTLTNYYGGSDQLVRFDNQIKFKSIQKGDMLVVCTDGLFKAVGMVKVKGILKEPMPLKERMNKIKSEAIRYEAPDNIGMILIEVI